MKTPFPLMGVSLLFWGWQTGLWPVALGMALVLEGSFFVKTRVDLAPHDYSRISDLCTLLLTAMFFYLLLSQRSAKALLLVFQWLPMALFPLALAQAYGASEKIPIYALLLLGRRRRKENGGPAMNLSHVYLGLCLLAASAANMRTVWFYPLLLLLCAWALWPLRSRRFPSLLWFVLLAWVGGFGYLGQAGLHRLQGYLENAATEWFTEFQRGDPDPYRATTSIGHVGLLKQSDRILFRVEIQTGAQRLLLREAAYNLYRSSRWFAPDSRFTTISAQRDGATWSLAARAGAGENKVVTVLSPLPGGKGMLRLPMGVQEIARLPVAKMIRNKFGAVRVEGGPGFVEYDVSFNPQMALDSPPTEADLALPEAERHAIQEIADKLGLASRPPQEVLRGVRAFFERHFLYSLALKEGNSKVTPILDFLTSTRKGHCEYFATATVLLLRALGLPARYATGFSVHEFSRWEKRFLVRERHGHAWVLVWMDGTWHDLDTTPSSWIAQENNSASFMEPVSDAWSWCILQFSRLRWHEGTGRLTAYVSWLLIPLVLALLLRFRGIRRKKAPSLEQTSRAATAGRKGLDSEFYEIEKALADAGFLRQSWETPSRWIESVSRDPSLTIPVENLMKTLSLHYRYRFDPKGITEQERSTLRSGAQSCLTAHRTTVR